MTSAMPTAERTEERRRRVSVVYYLIVRIQWRSMNHCYCVYFGSAS